jgi:hypothetical protein
MKHQMQRLFVPLGWAGLVLALLVLLLGAPDAPVSAGSPASLPPPQPASQAALGISNWNTVVWDTYDGTYTTTYRIPVTITGSGSADYRWGRVVSSGNSFSNTLWCVQDGLGASLTAGTDPYADNVTSTVTYGPMVFKNVVAADLSFMHWISVAGGDGLEWGYSTDGLSFSFVPVPAEGLPASVDEAVSPAAMGQWYTTTLNSATSSALAGLVGKDRVYLAFRFHSNGDGLVDKGVFLDNVRFQVQYQTNLYMPTVFRNWFTPYTYQDDFSNWSSGWPYGSVRVESLSGFGIVEPEEAIVDLEGDVSPFVALEYSWGYVKDPDNSAQSRYFIWVRDNGDHVWLTGPAQTWQNFDFHADARLWTTEMPADWGDEYGILISPKAINPSSPKADGVYTFQIRLKRSDSGTPMWIVKKWDIESTGTHPGDELAKGTRTDRITQEPKFFNILRIERNGSKLRFQVTRSGMSWVEVASVTDNSLPERLYIGFFAAHTGMYSYNMEYHFDNVYLYSYPW